MPVVTLGGRCLPCHFPVGAAGSLHEGGETWGSPALTDRVHVTRGSPRKLRLLQLGAATRYDGKPAAGAARRWLGSPSFVTEGFRYALSAGVWCVMASAVDSTELVVWWTAVDLEGSDPVRGAPG